MKILVSLPTLALTLTLSNDSFAHARFRIDIKDDNGKVLARSPTPPRDESTGLKSAPCGAVARTATPRVHKSGSTITVQWEETINHPGYFKIGFSKAGDKDFEILVPKIEDTQNEPINNMDKPSHIYSAEVKLPDIECTDCTLQLVQVMTDVSTAPEESLPPSAFYYSCSDIQLTRGAITDPQPGIPETPDNIEDAKPAKPTGVKVKEN